MSYFDRLDAIIKLKPRKIWIISKINYIDNVELLSLIEDFFKKRGFRFLTELYHQGGVLGEFGKEVFPSIRRDKIDVKKDLPHFILVKPGLKTLLISNKSYYLLVNRLTSPLEIYHQSNLENFLIDYLYLENHGVF